MQKRFTQNLLFTLLFAAQISVNAFGMDPTSLYELRRTGNEQLKLLPEIQAKIVTTILDIYLDELETIQEYYAKEIYPYQKEDRLPLYQKNTHTFIKKIMYWIERTRFSPVQENIDINTKTKKGNTFLYHVIKNAGDRENDHISDICTFTQYLLEHNANPNIQNKDGKTAFWHCMWNCLDRFNFSTFYSNSQKEIFKNLIQLFLKHNADPNASSHDGGLCLLAEREYSDMVKEILQHSDIKAFMNSKDKGTCTPAHSAAALLNINFLHILADAGADFNIKDSGGNTPLKWALGCKGDFMEDICGTERTDAVISLLQNMTQTSNQ